MTVSTFLWLSAAVIHCTAQQPTVTPISVPAVTYPAIASAARIRGDVTVSVSVRPDGTVAAATVEEGEPLLRDAALTAAKEARFECRGCGGVSVPYSLVFRFRLSDEQASPPSPWLTRLPDGQVVVIVVSGRAEYWYEGAVFSRVAVRSWKCLWLWRCGSRGYDGR
jgi:TonB family protein